MGNKKVTVCLLAILCLLIPELFAQQRRSVTGNQTIPELLRRPVIGEAPRYPVDMVIGTLGRGSAPEAAYLFARQLMSNLMTANSASVFTDNITDSIIEEINSLRPRSFRIGGGRVEPDGCVSFLIRFLGNNESITGELTIRPAEGRWILDGIILEERIPLSEIRDSMRFDFSPYERFF